MDPVASTRPGDSSITGVMTLSLHASVIADCISASSCVYDDRVPTDRFVCESVRGTWRRCLRERQSGALQEERCASRGGHGVRGVEKRQAQRCRSPLRDGRVSRAHLKGFIDAADIRRGSDVSDDAAGGTVEASAMNRGRSKGSRDVNLGNSTYLGRHRRCG